MDSVKLLKIANLFWKLSSIRSQTFDWNYFKSLKNSDEILVYASEHLEPIDEPGTARAVFILNSKWVLKIALPDNVKAGIAQNQNEKKFAQELKGLVAEVAGAHPQDLWIKSELVRPVLDLNELLKLLNLESPQDMMFLFGKFPPKNWKLKNPSMVARAVSELVRSGILHFDAMKSDSWGVTTDGKAVLLDYGMTPSTYKKHYRK